MNLKLAFAAKTLAQGSPDTLTLTFAKPKEAPNPMSDLAMGQNPVPPMSIPIPTKTGSNMGGDFTYPKMDPQPHELNFTCAKRNPGQ